MNINIFWGCMALLREDILIDGYEKVVKWTDDSCGLKAFIAIHDTSLGPALGGIRFYPYSTETEALKDVQRLSRGMTHKSCLADAGLGGGKAVVIVDPQKKSKQLVMGLAKAVDQLGGLYICAADYGCTMEDISLIKESTKYVVGGIYDKGSGDPGPYTAWGVIVSMKATLKHLFGTESFQGKKIAIQGLGSVGFKIAEHLFWLGARLTVADPAEEKVKAARERFDAEVVSVDEIMSTECTIFSPCALGGILNSKTIPELRCEAVVGCANNQLQLEKDAQLLKERGIIYAPDFVVNAGGLINVTFEIEEKGYNPRLAKEKIDKIYGTLTRIFEIAEESDTTTHLAASSLVEYRLKHLIGKREKGVYFHHTELAKV